VGAACDREHVGLVSVYAEPCDLWPWDGQEGCKHDTDPLKTWCNGEYVSELQRLLGILIRCADFEMAEDSEVAFDRHECGEQARDAGGAEEKMMGAVALSNEDPEECYHLRWVIQVVQMCEDLPRNCTS
jgi:hypothetical protein